LSQRERETHTVRRDVFNDYGGAFSTWETFL